ncbi:hypothetical protein [Lysinibacillus sp. fls2-241-R2A-57]|uniref:hypothetical protein n=1 Tax=Lysinibacillus sp. fls2-241-R2A-57 TaxID=3040292 RepID=UPI002557C13B|nr:hypothetical protein [Lysinibacillus sp. fls2-241-R2A-57]
MGIMINERQIISNIEIRWYLSSQIVWIGKGKNYYEIETLKNTSCGSFNWLWSDVDTILFDKDSLDFISAVIKLNEPIIVKRDKMSIVFTEGKHGNLKISEERNFDCKLSDFTEYYVEGDILLSYSEKWIRTKPSIEVKVTLDFSIVLQNSEMIGIVIYKASKHLLPDSEYLIDENENIESDICIMLGSFFQLLEKIDDDLTQHERSELKNLFLEIYEQALPYDDLRYKALRDTILNVIDYI